MKEDLLRLIAQIDSIEAQFHHTTPTSGLAIPALAKINDVPDFQLWIQKVQLESQEIVTRTGDQFVTDALACAKEKYNGWNDKKNFAELKGKLIAMSEKMDLYYPKGDETEMTSNMRPRIFISHSTNDKPYIEKIVALLDDMGLDQTQVFCSSIPGYDVPVGKTIFEYLREQFLEYNLHVIFVHSKSYYQSAVCLNEMGAAWALKTEYTSLLLPGFDFDQMVGVVDDSTIAIKLDNELIEVQDKLNQLYSKIADEFELRKKSDIIWEQKRNRFIEDILQIPVTTSEIDSSSDESDIEMLESGVLVRKSENANGKHITYCPACYQNYKKLFPIVRGSARRDYFCSNCKMHYTRR